MVVDRLENLEKYASLNPLFAKAMEYLKTKPGMFAIFFPQDAHAPGVSPDGVKKVIVKVLV